MRNVVLALSGIPLVLGTVSVRPTTRANGSAPTQNVTFPTRLMAPRFTFSNGTQAIHLDAVKGLVTSRRTGSSALLTPYVELFGPTEITESGTYLWIACSRGCSSGTVNVHIFPIIPPGTPADPAEGTSVAAINGQDACPGIYRTITETSAHYIAVTGHHCDNAGENCDSAGSASQVVTNNIYAVWWSGPQTRQTGQSGTWNAVLYAGNSVAPYSYVWSGALSGTGTSISGTIAYPGDDLTLTVTDANGRTKSVTAHIYVCDDIC